MKQIIIMCLILLAPILSRAQEIDVNLFRRIKEHASINTYEEKSTVLKALKCINMYRPYILKNIPFDDIDIAAIILIESHFDRFAVSNKGAMGLMQVTHTEYFEKTFGEIDYFDITQNIVAGMKVLRDKYNHHNDKRIAIIAYNGIIINGSRIVDTYWRKFVVARRNLGGKEIDENTNKMP